MDIRGFEQLEKVMAGAGIDAEVYPTPIEGADVHFVTIRTPATETTPSHVLNALRYAGVLHNDGPSDMGGGSLSLDPIGVQEGSITFQDQNVWPAR